MPLTRPVDKPTITAEQINSLMEAIEDPHDLCLMAIGLFCATRTSETFGLPWKSYQQDKLIIQTTAFEGRLYNRVKNEASRSAVPILEDIRPIIEAWRGVCPDSSPDALMFPALGSRARRNEGAAASQKLPQMADLPDHRQARNPTKAGYLSGDAADVGKDLQEHGTMKDALAALHASIKTTANVYMQPIPASVTAALNSRTKAVLSEKAAGFKKTSEGMLPNAPQFQKLETANA